MAKQREDETLLQYLIRLAKEGGKDFAEGYGELANQRLIRSRPDVARERGLMPDQWVEDDYMTPGVQDSLLPPQVTDTAGADRAAIEQMATQRPPVFLDKDITSVLNYQPTLDRDLTGLQTPRMPEVVDPSVASRGATGEWTVDEEVPYAQIPESISDIKDPSYILNKSVELGGGDWSSSTLTGPEELNKRLEAAATQGDPYAGVNPGLIDMVTGITEEQEILESDKKTPSKLDARLTTGKGVGYTKPVATFSRWFTEDTPVGEFFFGDGEDEDPTEPAYNWSGIDNVLKAKKDKVPTKAQGNKNAEKESKKTVKEKPSFDGHNSKAEFFKAMGLSAEGNKYYDRMEKIDSESRMFDFIAMLGGAVNSNVGTNFRNKSYQRLRTEMQIDNTQWDRAYKMFSHPWDTWFDEKGVRDPISRLRGTGSPGDGFSKTRPPKETVTPITTPTRFLQEIKSSYDGSESSLGLIIMQLAMDDTVNWGMDREGALESSALYVQKLLKLDFTPWTDTEKNQARAMMSKGDVQNLMRMINSKSGKEQYIPEDLKAEVEAFLTQEMREKYDPDKDPSSSRMGLGGNPSRRFE